MIRALAAALVIPLAAAASDPLAGRAAGSPEQCIDLPANVGPEIVDAHTILYRRNERVIYRTTIEGCPALRPLTTLIVDVYGGQLCRNDRFRVLEPNAIIASGYCRFGAFVPYAKVTARSD